MATADIPDWTQLIDLVESLSPGQDFPDWTVGVQAPIGSPISGPFVNVGEAIDVPVIVHTVNPSSGNWGYTPISGTPDFFISNVTPVVNDFCTFNWAGPAGTYSLQESVEQGPAEGIQTVSVDGTVVGHIDGYAGSLQWEIGSISGIVVSTAGNHTLEYQMLTKNALSSGYECRLKQISIQRTA